MKQSVARVDGVNGLVDSGAPLHVSLVAGVRGECAPKLALGRFFNRGESRS